MMQLVAKMVATCHQANSDLITRFLTQLLFNRTLSNSSFCVLSVFSLESPVSLFLKSLNKIHCDKSMNDRAEGNEAINNSVVESEEMRFERLSRELDALVGSIPNFRRIGSSEVIDNSTMERLYGVLEYLQADIAEQAARDRRERAKHERPAELRNFETLRTFHMLVDDESTHASRQIAAEYASLINKGNFSTPRQSLSFRRN